jgi:hypothetical protein
MPATRPFELVKLGELYGSHRYTFDQIRDHDYVVVASGYDEVFEVGVVIVVRKEDYKSAHVTGSHESLRAFAEMIVDMADRMEERERGGEAEQEQAGS